MGNIATIVTGIKTRVAAELGSTYSELAHTIDVSKNNFKGSSKRYGVISQAHEQTDGTFGRVTLAHTFKIVLTDYYASPSTSDSAKLTSGITLQEKMGDIYVDLVNNQCGAPSLVILTDGLEVEEPEYLEDTNVVVVVGTVRATYRKTL